MTFRLYRTIQKRGASRQYMHLCQPNDVSPELSSRPAADRLGGGEEALLQSSLVGHFEQVLSETKKDARRSAA